MKFVTCPRLRKSFLRLFSSYLWIGQRERRYVLALGCRRLFDSWIAVGIVSRPSWKVLRIIGGRRFLLWFVRHVWRLNRSRRFLLLESTSRERDYISRERIVDVWLTETRLAFWRLQNHPFWSVLSINTFQFLNRLAWTSPILFDKD